MKSLLSSFTYWILLIMFFLLDSSCFGQFTPAFTKHDFETGFNGKAIRNIFEDDAGFIWTSTWHGLYKYDGKKHHKIPTPGFDFIEKVYKIGNRLIILGSTIVDGEFFYPIAEINEGANSLKIIHTRTHEEASKSTIIPFNDKYIEYSHTSYAVYNNDMSFSHIVQFEELFSKTIDPPKQNKTSWIENAPTPSLLTNNGRTLIVLENDLREIRFVKTLDNEDYFVASTGFDNDSIALLTNRFRVHYYSNKKNALSKGIAFPEKDIQEIKNWTFGRTNMLRGNYNDLWVNLNNFGLLKFNIESNTLVKIPLSKELQNARSFIVDKSNSIWMGMDAYLGSSIGLINISYNAINESFQKCTVIPPSSLHVTDVQICNQTAYILSPTKRYAKEKELIRTNLTMNRPEKTGLKFLTGHTSPLKIISDSILLIVESRAINLYNVYTNDLQKYSLSGSDGVNIFGSSFVDSIRGGLEISRVIPQNKNILWLVRSWKNPGSLMGKASELIQMNLKTRRVSVFPLPEERRNSIITQLVLHKNNIIAVIGVSGILIFDLKKKKWVNSINGSKINLVKKCKSIYNISTVQVKGNTLHIASEREGLSGIDIYTGKYVYQYNNSYNPKNSVALPNIYSDQMIDKKGNIWAISEGNLFHIYRKTGIVKKINFSSQKNSFLRFFRKNKVGDYFILQGNQLFWWDPSNFPDINPTKPIVNLDYIKVFRDKEFNLTSKTGLQKLKSYENSIEISLHSIHNYSGNKLKHLYQVQGLFEGWRLTESPKVKLDDLKSGSYVFRFKSISADGIESEIITLDIIIAPPWYNTNGAYLLFFAGGILVIGSVIYLRTRNLEKRRKELEIQVKKSTQEIIDKTKEVDRQKDENIEMSKRILEQDKQLILSETANTFAHGLNTPLGVIKAGAEGIEYLCNELFSTLINKCTAEQIQFGFNYAKKINRKTLDSGTALRNRRSIIKNMLLTDYGLNEKEADDLSRSLQNIYQKSESKSLLGFLLIQENKADVIDLITSFISLHRITKSTVHATEQSAQVVESLKRALKQRKIENRVDVNIKNNIESVLDVLSDEIAGKATTEISIDPSHTLLNKNEFKLFQLWSNMIAILLSQDDEQLHIKIKSIRKTSFYEVIFVTNTAEALNIFDESIYDIIINQKATSFNLSTAIVKNIIEEYKGSIRVINNKGINEYVLTIQEG